VAGVSPDGPAEDAGIETGDIILEFDGEPVVEMRHLPRIVADTPIGKAVDVKLLRKGEEKHLQVTVGRLEEGEQVASLDTEEEEAVPEEPESTTISALGLDLSDLNEELRDRYKVDDTIDGAVVTEVDPSGPAAERQIRAGDIIVEVAQEKVMTAADVRDELAKLKDKGRKSALLLVSRSLKRSSSIRERSPGSSTATCTRSAFPSPSSLNGMMRCSVWKSTGSNDAALGGTSGSSTKGMSNCSASARASCLGVIIPMETITEPSRCPLP
jgi:membrane-associated protease RseP (regulator of RpoE activity)